MPPIAIVGAMVASSIASAAIGSHAAGKAASAQAGAAQSAAELQHEDAQAALAFQKQQYETQQKNMAPWLQSGQDALSRINANLPGFQQQLGQQFQAPTGATEVNDPGYQFRLQQGMKALENSAAARGGLLSGNTLQAEQNYGQNYASGEYGNVYNRAFNQYQSNRQNVLDKYNMLAGLAGTGQTAATTLGQEGQAAAGNIGNIYLNSGQQIGNSLQNAGAARASGYVGGANAWGGALGGITNNLSTLAMLGQLGGGGGYYGYTPGMNENWGGG